jgi:hypothetical protein
MHFLVKDGAHGHLEQLSCPPDGPLPLAGYESRAARFQRLRGYEFQNLGRMLNQTVAQMHVTRNGAAIMVDILVSSPWLLAEVVLYIALLVTGLLFALLTSPSSGPVPAQKTASAQQRAVVAMHRSSLRGLANGAGYSRQLRRL